MRTSLKAPLAIAASFTLFAAAPSFSDWDPVLEAKEQAARKAAQAEASKRNAEAAAKRKAAQDEANRKMAASYRKTYGERTRGLSDEQVLAAGRQWDMDRVKNANQQLAETLKQLPPEQRAMAEQMMRQTAQQK